MRSGHSREISAASSRRTWMRKPLAVSFSSMPRPEYSAARAASAARTCWALGRALSSNSRVSSATGSGVPAASSAASMTFLTYDSLMRDPHRRAGGPLSGAPSTAGAAVSVLSLTTRSMRPAPTARTCSGA